VNEEVSRDVTSEADGINQGVVPLCRLCFTEIRQHVRQNLARRVL